MEPPVCVRGRALGGGAGWAVSGAHDLGPRPPDQQRLPGWTSSESWHRNPGAGTCGVDGCPGRGDHDVADGHGPAERVGRWYAGAESTYESAKVLI